MEGKQEFNLSQIKRERSNADSSTTPDQAKEPLWTPLFIAVVVSTFCLFLTAQGLNAGMTVYLDRIGQPAALSGLLAAITAGACAITRLASGPLVDRRGRAAMMTAGALLLVASTFLTTFAANVVPLTICRILQGIGFSLGTTATATMASDILPFRRLGEGIGYYGLGQALAMAVGPMLALTLALMNPPQMLFIGLTAVALVVLALVPLCRYEKDPRGKLAASSAYFVRWNRGRGVCAEGRPREGRASAQKRGLVSQVFEKDALPGTIPLLALAPVFGFGIVFVGLYGCEIGVGSAGLFFTFAAASMIAVRLLLSRRINQANPVSAFGAAALAGIVCFSLLLAASVCAPLYYLAGFFYGLCLGISQPLGQSIAVRNIPSERLGAANALYLLAIDAGFGVGAIAWGILSDTVGFAPTILCVMACIVLSFLLARRYYPRSLRSGRNG